MKNIATSTPNLYRPKFRDRKTNELRETDRWYIDFRDSHGTRQRFAGDIDKHTTAEFGRMLIELVRCRKRNLQPKDKLWSWLQGQPAEIQERLVKLDLAERQWFAALSQAERLSTWVVDYEYWLRNSIGKNGYHRNKNYISVTMTRVRNIVEGCSFKAWQDIHTTAIENYLGGLSVTRRTHNGYITSFKCFCTWCVKGGKAEFSKVQYLDRVMVPNTEKRRPLSNDEVVKLLTVTVNAHKRYGMTGMERAILYRLAIESGFRVNELRNLTADCFDLKKAVVKLEAKHCKDRRDALQPITMALALSLGDYLSKKSPQDRVFNLRTCRTALMIQADAADAGLPIYDEQGRELVFHSLRHTLRTELVKVMVTEAVIDNIMRHKPLGIGQRFYTHITEFQIREAIQRLPDYPWPGELIQQVRKAVS